MEAREHERRDGHGIQLSEEGVSWDPARRYLRGDALGAGGMGDVEIQRDQWLGREVARKMLHEAREEPDASRLRFVREMQVQAQLEHPAIVPVYDAGVDAPGRRWFTMRRVRGPTFAQIVEALASGDAEAKARYSRRKLLTAFVSVCLAVHYAHTRGVLHRDLKPSNVMLGEFGEVYVLDWGAAKLLHAEGPAPSADTEEGAIVGTPAYMAPEQLLGEPARDARSDVYALGLTLYELLAGQPVHGDRTTSEIIEATFRGLDVRPSAHAPDVAPELDAVCARATARRAAERFGSAQELADAVERYLDGDRDLERRRALAGEHAARAQEAAAREGDAGRAEAMRDVVKALAFDPTQPDATRTLVDLMVKVPEKMPAEAEVEMEQAALRSRVESAKLAFMAELQWLVFAPVGLWLGVRSSASYAASIAAIVAAVFYSLWMWRARRVAPRHNYVLTFFNATAVALTSAFLGPFVLVPMCAAVMTLMIATPAMRRERPVLILFGSLVVVVPFALELLHLVPPSYLFEQGRMVLLARGFELPPRATIGVLFYLSVTWTILPPLFLGRLRDELSRAERALFLRAWHLKRLLPEGPMTPPSA